MKYLTLTNGMQAMVDDEDYERVAVINWTYLIGKGYASGRVNHVNTMLHRFILDIHPGDPIQIDHRNGIKLDCQKHNLRQCNNSQNAMNRKITINSSRYKGVYWKANRWAAQIGFMGKKFYLGRYKSETDAALAYNEAALKLFGEFANLNLVRGSTRPGRDQRV
jgi:AP2-like factor (euAP2 lineage)